MAEAAEVREKTHTLEGFITEIKEDYKEKETSKINTYSSGLQRKNVVVLIEESFKQGKYIEAYILADQFIDKVFCIFSGKREGSRINISHIIGPIIDIDYGVESDFKKKYERFNKIRNDLSHRLLSGIAFEKTDKEIEELPFVTVEAAVSFTINHLSTILWPLAVKDIIRKLDGQTGIKLTDSQKILLDRHRSLIDIKIDNSIAKLLSESDITEPTEVATIIRETTEKELRKIFPTLG